MEGQLLEARPVPGPTDPRWKKIRDARRDLLGFFTRQAELYGDLVALRQGFTYLAVHPQYVQHVLQENHLNYVKGPRFRSALGPLIGDGLLAVDGDDWRRQRRRAQPYFLRKGHRAYVETVTPAVTEVFDRFSALARTGETVALNTEMDRLAVAASVRMMCGPDALDDVDTLVRAFVETGHSLDPTSAFNPFKLPEFIPTPGRIRFKRAVESVDRIIYRLVETRRHNPNPPDDLLSGLIFHRDGEPGGDKRLRDEIMTMLHAGFETVSDQIVWNIFALGRHADVRARVQDECDRCLNGRIPTFEDLQALPYLHMVLQEIMRLYPAAWGYFRAALADDHVDGYRIPAGAIVMLCPYVTHRLPDIWDNPDAFRPERFRSEETARRHRFAFFPFGSGPRHCIGGEVAGLLIAMTVAMLLQRFDIQPLPDQQTRPVPRISLKPEPALRVRIRPRRH